MFDQVEFDNAVNFFKVATWVFLFVKVADFVYVKVFGDRAVREVRRLRREIYANTVLRDLKEIVIIKSPRSCPPVRARPRWNESMQGRRLF